MKGLWSFVHYQFPDDVICILNENNILNKAVEYIKRDFPVASEIKFFYKNVSICKFNEFEKLHIGILYYKILYYYI